MSKGTNREREAAEKKIDEALREAKRRVKASDRNANFWSERYTPLFKAVTFGTSDMITESGVSAARQANVPYDWFWDWAKEDLPNLVAQGYIKAHIELEKRENAWSSRAKKAFWYIVGIIATAIVTYYVALAGFKV